MDLPNRLIAYGILQIAAAVALRLYFGYLARQPPRSKGSPAFKRNLAPGLTGWKKWVFLFGAGLGIWAALIGIILATKR